MSFRAFWEPAGGSYSADSCSILCSMVRVLHVISRGLVIWVIVMVIVVHTLEAYVLNPLIFGAHLHMNPVLVLAVLLIGHELFGIWGLLLGVPTVTYFFGYAIRYEDARPGRGILVVRDAEGE